MKKSLMVCLLAVLALACVCLTGCGKERVDPAQEAAVREMGEIAEMIKAAKAGDADAAEKLLSMPWKKYYKPSMMTELARIYMSPEKKEKKELTFRLALAGADEGDAEGQYLVGLLYSMGVGTQEDLDKAIQYYKMAAEQGLAKALDALGNVYINLMDDGHSENTSIGVSYYMRAVEMGYADAMWDLGDFYAKKMNDYETALSWYDKAFENGFIAQYKFEQEAYLKTMEEVVKLRNRNTASPTASPTASASGSVLGSGYFSPSN